MKLGFVQLTRGAASVSRHLDSYEPLIRILGRDINQETLTSRGVSTLLFAGANLDQCVACSLQDAFIKGCDCFLLKDVCATTSPEFARRFIEFTAQGGWGVMLCCEALAKGVDNIQISSSNGRISKVHDMQSSRRGGARS